MSMQTCFLQPRLRTRCKPLSRARQCARTAGREMLTLFTLMGMLHGCAIEPAPAGNEIRQQALGAMRLDQPWKAATTRGIDTVQDNWLASFKDPTLDALVREGLANNPDLRVAAARMEQATQQLIIAESAMKPSIAAFGTGGTKTSGGGDATSALQAIVLAASWELDLWGRVRYARNAARETYASSQADFEFARQSLAATIAKTWFALTQLSLQRSITAEMVTASSTLLALAEERERIGAGTPAETAVARAAVRNLENSQQQVDYARGQTLRALELLVGRYPAGAITESTQLVALPGPLPAGVPLQMLERRPDVIAAERRVAAAFNRVGEARAARLPQLTLTLNFGAFSSEILQLRQDFENPAGGLGARLLAPIYEGGAITARVEIATAAQKEAVADYARIALRAIGDVEDSLAASESLAARAQSLTLALEEQTRALDYTLTNLRVGRADRRALEQQRLNVHSARAALLSVQAEQLSERVNLYLSLGGSFEPPRR